MFFTRLRRHAKWMFVFLALTFGVGFVVFGIGAAGSGGSLGDLLRDQGGTSNTPSVEDARQRVQENPKSAEAQRDLATALSVDARTVEAIVALTRYTELQPRDESALRELAGLYLTEATRLQQVAEVAQLRANYLTAGSTFIDPLQLPSGAPAAEDPIVDAIATEANKSVSAAYNAAQLEYRNAADAYEKVVGLAPNDPNIQLDLAQASQRAGDFPRAIAAYQEFVRLAPDDGLTPQVKQRIRELKASTTSSG